MGISRKYEGKKIFRLSIYEWNLFFRRYYWLVALILVVVAWSIYQFLLLPQITLKGSKVVILNYKEKYVEKGASAFFSGRDVTDKIVVSGKVDSQKLGTYKISYFVQVGSFHRRIYRKVIVKDTSAPTILLPTKGTIYVCPGKKYQKEKYQAIDNYDGDVTKKVKVKESKNEIIYQVTDRAHNHRRLSRKIVYQDKEKPTLTLQGGDIVYAFVGENYEEKGYQALDNCDGNLSKKVKVSGKVDTSRTGEYKITYSVSDKSSNSVEALRRVIVSEHGKPGTIYLTFDDGPKEGTTNIILDILKQEGIPATFFVTNNGPDSLIKRASDEGHSIGLHTASHNYALVYASVDSYFQDLQVVSDRVKNITGSESKLIRFPGGSSNTISKRYSAGIMSALTREVLMQGYKYYDWNLSSGDAEAGVHEASEIVSNVTSSLSKERVNMVLLHDIKPYTRDALLEIIHYGKENGYVFEKITMDTEMITQRVNN